ncbi:zinc finger protein 658B-like isoform X2 [Trichogramma pretiosum]|uniref:zinc finger protein 658B-like isoform X2 n=1 Tax=Trichogramma pretiosum TaxID=7493 RepID=UPI000C71B1F7|nr:zinc finger protein 658B-like isoform X2 [Trichogramma pretiosum]
MESNAGDSAVRVKKEPDDTSSNEDDNHVFNTVDIKIPAEKNAALQKRVDKNVIIDLECQDVKIESPALSTKIIKTENQNCSPIVKFQRKPAEKNAALQKTVDKNVIIDFECQDVKIESPALSTKIIKTENQNSPPMVKFQKKRVKRNAALQKKLNKDVIIDFECQDVKIKSLALSTKIIKTENQNSPPMVKFQKKRVKKNAALQKKLNKDVIIDFECQDVKIKSLALSTKIIKTENQNCPPIVKAENENVTNSAREKSLIILIKKGYNYDSNCQMNVEPHVKLAEPERPRNHDKTTAQKTCDYLRMCQKMLTARVCLKRLVLKKRKSISPSRCAVSEESFSCEVDPNFHSNEVESPVEPTDDTNKKINTKRKSISPSRCAVSEESFSCESDSNVHSNEVENPVELTNDTNKKRLKILIKKGYNYDDNCYISVKSRIELAENEELQNFEQIAGKKLHKSKMSLKSNKAGTSQNKSVNKNFKNARTYDCSVCKKSCSSSSARQKHILAAHSRDKPFVCDICGKSYSYAGSLTVHVNSVHERTRTYTCDICSKSFGLKRNLRSHINFVHSRVKPFECDICQKSFSYKGTLSSHISTVHDGVKSFECNICHKTFSGRGNLVQHVNAVHDNNKKLFECDVCQRSFSHRRKLRRHKTLVHDGRKIFECDICRKKLGSKNAVRNHIRVIHNGIKPFECEICHKSFGFERTLNNHRDAVHDRSKPFDCEICRRSLASKDDLEKHVEKEHFRDKPFKCDVCGKSFSHQEGLDSHKNSVHDQTQSFECKICHKSYFYKSYLYTHLASVHYRNKVFKCEICNKSFSRKDTLRNHNNRFHK